MPVTIAEESPEHHTGVAELLANVFGGTAETELVNELREGGFAVAARVAFDERGLAGYVLFSELGIEISGACVAGVALAPLAVRADCRNRGIGAALVRAGLAASKTKGKSLVIVVGAPAYYARFGFSQSLAQGLSAPFQGPAMQLLELKPGTRGSGVGRVVYPLPFARFV